LLTILPRRETKRTSGKWNDLDSVEVCRQLDIPYVVEMISGVFAFDKSAVAAAFSGEPPSAADRGQTIWLVGDR